MKRDCLTVFIVGPPAAGKSTLARAVAAELDVTFRTIDDFTPRGESMTDAQIQQALDQLFDAIGPGNEIVEFCHHDYDDVIDENKYPIFSSAAKILVTAPLAVCSARNRVRLSPVREAYIERAWQSGQSLAKRCLAATSNAFLMIDTGAQSKDAAISAAVGFFKERWRLQ